VEFAELQRSSNPTVLGLVLLASAFVPDQLAPPPYAALDPSNRQQRPTSTTSLAPREGRWGTESTSESEQVRTQPFGVCSS